MSTSFVDSDGTTRFRGTIIGGGWVEFDILASAPAWQDDGQGTWTFGGGVISQTDPTGDSTNQCVTSFPSLDYVVDADVRIKSGQDAGTTAQAVISAGNRDFALASVSGALSAALGEGATILGDTTGDAATFHTAPVIDAALGNFDSPVVAAVTLNTWHTLRAVVSPVRQAVYIDSAYLCSVEKRNGGNDGSNTDLVMIGAIGLVDFRNVKVWTRTLPL